MLRIIPFALAAALAVPESAKAWVTENGVDPEEYKSVAVSVLDNADEGCWTNLGEARTYAEDKLSELGFQIQQDDDDEDQLTMTLHVHSTRGPMGCFGVIDIELIAPAWIWSSNSYAWATLGESGGIFSGHDNANVIILDYIKDMIEDMESKAGSDV